MSRYDALIALVEHHHPRTIVEIGTWNGDRAIQMVLASLKHNDSVHYTGFDLFEDATDETDARELNVKKHFSRQEVDEKLRDFAHGLPENKAFTWTLVKGDTKTTLRGLCAEQCGPLKADFAFIDGGHSVETIQNDWECVKESSVVVFDDWYEADAHGNCPDLEKFGCNKVVVSLSPALVGSPDPVRGGGLTRLAVVPQTAVPKSVGGKANMIIQTKNCVDVSEIQANIRHTLSYDPPRWPNLAAHDFRAVMCSAGPSLEVYLDEIRNHIDNGAFVACVKHAHDRLIENGIIPWACILLDPRGHVKDFIENPHPDVNYVIASMCHPTTVDHLLQRGANVWVYHAAVGAEENEILKYSGRQEWLVGGGSSSALRGISVMHMAGFRNFDCYGYDSSFPSMPDVTVDANGRPSAFEVEVNGRSFFSDYEKLAEVQDWEKARKNGFFVNMRMHGSGMIPHIERIMRRTANEAFRRAFDGPDAA